jgi:methylmalonyl-CoA mutase
VTNEGYATPQDLGQAFLSSGTKAVCIASSDAIYAIEAVSAVTALKAAGAGPIFFAGKPGEGFQEDRLRAAGVDAFLFAGQDAIAVLADAAARIQATGLSAP